MGATEYVPSALYTMMIKWGYFIMLIFGYICEFMSRMSGGVNTFGRAHKENYATLFEHFDYFYNRWMYQRMSDCWNRPITGCPGTWIDVWMRKSEDGNSSFVLTGQKKHSLNLGSYNYLGFAENNGPVMEENFKTMGDFTSSTSSSYFEGGKTKIHQELEETIAEFVGKEKAMVFEMGYATNSTTLPALVPKGGLIISDSLNHASLVVGSRSSTATIKVFKHNDTEDLERVLQQALEDGQPGNTHKPWRMIFIVVEGIYSMEGVICRLPEIIRIKKKYKAYLYVDEAHSIGALGPRGRGVCDYFGTNPADVDVLMGTFTKSFGSVGGYIAASKEIITYLSASSFGTAYSTSMSPICAQQALSALHIIMGKDGTDTGAKKLQQLRENSNFFRTRLQEMGFIIFGNHDSPIIPLMLYAPSKFPSFSRRLLQRGIAAVVVAFPATDMLGGRARFCLSAGHTREDLEWALEHIREVGDECRLKLKV